MCAHRSAHSIPPSLGCLPAVAAPAPRVSLVHSQKCCRAPRWHRCHPSWSCGEPGGAQPRSAGTPLVDGSPFKCHPVSHSPVQPVGHAGGLGECRPFRLWVWGGRKHRGGRGDKFPHGAVMGIPVRLCRDGGRGERAPHHTVLCHSAATHRAACGGSAGTCCGTSRGDGQRSVGTQRGGEGVTWRGNPSPVSPAHRARGDGHPRLVHRPDAVVLHPAPLPPLAVLGPGGRPARWPGTSRGGPRASHGAEGHGGARCLHLLGRPGLVPLVCWGQGGREWVLVLC